MCPRQDFGFEYRSLIETYRLAPETSKRQCLTILDRLAAVQGRYQKPERPKKEKGGDSQ